jgi:hypothetical protein
MNQNLFQYFKGRIFKIQFSKDLKMKKFNQNLDYQKPRNRIARVYKDKKMTDGVVESVGLGQCLQQNFVQCLPMRIRFVF